ncbi:MAG: DNA-3-methyladenine glycosylase 2 family protein [Defluviitaleaceae bacterium]|nr:DNA-3-methyladenine glycosylase 2 family protein [Defluviitaleaceae bacterium]
MDCPADYSKIEQIGGDVVLYDIKHFSLPEVLNCGQCFRFNASENTENQYTGVAHGRQLVLAVQAGNLIIKNVTLAEFYSIWQDYFDLQRNYANLRNQYASDPTLKKATEFSQGLRIMRQEPWETLVSYILSQNCNIPRIKNMVESLCQHFGEQLPNKNFAFPTPQRLAKLSVDDLAPIKTGYRAAYIIDAAKKAAAELDLSALQEMSTDKIRQQLLKIHGVGPKVADCVLLYGFGRTEVFPIDVWIKRVLAKYYPNGFPPQNISKTAGIAQQFLFHYERSITL